MRDAEGLERARSGLATARRLHLAMLATLVGYLAIVQLVRRIGIDPGARDPFADLAWLRYPAYVLALAALAAVPVAARRLLTRGVAVRPAPGAAPADAVTMLVSRNAILYVLGEIPVILGLVLYFVGGYLVDFYLLLVASLLAILLATPREHRWLAAVEHLSAGPPERSA
jgi:hypothetical protein